MATVQENEPPEGGERASALWPARRQGAPVRGIDGRGHVGASSSPAQRR
jgi:hypothetical protein